MNNFVCLITGPAGAGKSTISNLLCKEYDNTVHLPVDIIRHFIINGKVKPFPYTEESNGQIRLAVKNTCKLTKNYLEAGYNVFIDDVVVKKEKLDLYYKLLEDSIFYTFLLMPDKKTVVKRDQGRPQEDQMGDRVLGLHDEFSEAVKTERRWNIIDTTDQSPLYTLEYIKSNIFLK